MPSNRGDFCMRCGAKSTKRVENGKLIKECPNRHGIQHMEDAPAEDLPAEAAETEADRRDDVAEAVDRGPGSHN